jgi:predicted nucleotidyltransferase
MNSQEPPILHSHERGRPQGWETADADIRAFVESSVGRVADQLGSPEFVGAYLHGSLAMGSFYRPKSDLDILFVVEESLLPHHRRQVALTLCHLSDERPNLGDLEVSVLRRADTANFHQPLPFELHYSEKWKSQIRRDVVDWAPQRTDPELAVYCCAVQARGICLRGTPIRDAFSPVPTEDTRAAILDDLDWTLEEDHILESPYYGVLNCCRVLLLQNEGWDQVLSKDEGGEWALQHLPQQYQQIVAQALACYRSPEDVPAEQRRTDGHGWDQTALRAMCSYVASQVPDRTGPGLK